jgi:hypothetical protein
MEQHIVFDRIFRVGIVGATEVQHLFPGTDTLYKLDALNDAKFIIH